MFWKRKNKLQQLEQRVCDCEKPYLVAVGAFRQIKLGESYSPHKCIIVAQDKVYEKREAISFLREAFPSKMVRVNRYMVYDEYNKFTYWIDEQKALADFDSVWHNDNIEKGAVYPMPEFLMGDKDNRRNESVLT